MTPFITEGTIDMEYIFNQDYVDLCHPNHPDCVTGTTCSDCNDGFNPMLDVSCNLILFGDNPINHAFFVGVDEYWKGELTLQPNPTNGIINLEVTKPYPNGTPIQIYNISGHLMKKI